MFGEPLLRATGPLVIVDVFPTPADSGPARDSAYLLAADDDPLRGHLNHGTFDERSLKAGDRSMAANLNPGNANGCPANADEVPVIAGAIPTIANELHGKYDGKKDGIGMPRSRRVGLATRQPTRGSGSI